MAKTSWITLTNKQIDELSALKDAMGNDPTYLIVPQEQIPSVYDAFRQKLDSAVVMSSTTPQGTVFVGINALRVDEKAHAIDQDPFGIAFLSTGPMPSGVFIHHGGWSGRTETKVPPGFWDVVLASGVGNQFPHTILPTNSTGPLSTLAGTSHDGALNAVFKKLKEQTEKQEWQWREPNTGHGGLLEDSNFAGILSLNTCPKKDLSP